MCALFFQKAFHQNMLHQKNILEWNRYWPNHAMQLTGSARHGLCSRPEDLPAQAAPRSACS